MNNSTRLFGALAAIFLGGATLVLTKNAVAGGAVASGIYCFICAIKYTK